MGSGLTKLGIDQMAFGQPSLKTKQFGLTEGKMTKNLIKHHFQCGLAEGKMTKCHFCLLTKKSSQHGSQNTCEQVAIPK